MDHCHKLICGGLRFNGRKAIALILAQDTVAIRAEPEQLAGTAIDGSYVVTCAGKGDGYFGRDPVQIVLVGNAGRRPAILIPAAADQPAISALACGEGSTAGFNEGFKRVCGGKIHLTLGADIGNQVHVCIGECRGHRAPAKVDHLCLGGYRCTNLLLRAKGGNTAIHYGKRRDERGSRIQRMDGSVDIKLLHKVNFLSK